MIKYALKCHKDHTFDVWFKSIDFAGIQIGNKEVVCPICSSNKVKKAIVAPQYVSSSKSSSTKAKNSVDVAKSIINKFKKDLEKNYTYVGKDFYDKAYKMHYGEIKKENIYGESTKEEILDLIENEVDVLPLPFGKNKKVN